MTPAHRIDGPPDAPVVVLANSLGTDHRMWDAQAPILARHFRVIRYDARGHGATPWTGDGLAIEDLAADVIAVLDANGIGRASIVGVSLGGMTAMAVARLAPERVDRLVPCCTSARLGPPQAWHDRAALVRAEGTDAVAATVTARWFTPAFAARHADVVVGVAAMLRATDDDAYAACCDAIAAMDQLDAIASITAPTLVISGADDPATPPEHGAAIAAAIPGARHVVVPAAAHLANIERPDVVTAALLAHLAPDAIVDDLVTATAGERVRRAVLGDAHVDAAAQVSPAVADFQRYLTSAAWGAVWARPGLDHRTRSAITVAMLVALGHDDELRLHLRAARRNGLTVDELREILLQTAVYCGVPAANHAHAIALAAGAFDHDDDDDL